jgi:hypothetical protein
MVNDSVWFFCRIYLIDVSMLLASDLAGLMIDTPEQVSRTTSLESRSRLLFWEHVMFLAASTLAVAVFQTALPRTAQ